MNTLHYADEDEVYLFDNGEVDGEHIDEKKVGESDILVRTGCITQFRIFHDTTYSCYLQKLLTNKQNVYILSMVSIFLCTMALYRKRMYRILETILNIMMNKENGKKNNKKK